MSPKKLLEIVSKWPRYILWWLQYRLHPKHQYHVLRTGLKPGYHDPDNQILYACMNAVCRYVDTAHSGLAEFEQHAREIRHSGHKQQADAMEEIVAIYRWWKIDRPRKQATAGKLLHMAFSKDVPLPASNEALLGKSHQLDDECDREDDEYLIRVMKIRGWLWY